MKWAKVAIILAALVGGAVLVTRGTPDPEVSLSSLVELWSDTLRNTDQIGMKLTRVSDAEEMRIGAGLARDAADLGAEDASASAYVTAIAQPLIAHLHRKGIRYQFHVVDSPQINAFALPGGQIFVMRGLVEFADSEAELAGVLGHEMSHVDLRHCIEHYQYQAKLGKAGAPALGSVVEMAHRLIMMGFSAEQESEADAQGERMSIEAGYDPYAAAALFARMQGALNEPRRVQSNTPVGEVTQASVEALEAYFRTHPPSEERVRKLNAMVGQHRNELAGHTFYVGRQNLRERVPRSSREYPGEYRQF
jgi:predicted Zn-dependent protease